MSCKEYFVGHVKQDFNYRSLDIINFDILKLLMCLYYFLDIPFVINGFNLYLISKQS